MPLNREHPVHVGVHIDEPGSDHLAAAVNDMGVGLGGTLLDGFNLLPRDQQMTRKGRAAGAIHDQPVFPICDFAPATVV